MIDCYSAQLRAINAHFPMAQLRALRDTQDVLGKENGTFAHVTPHTHPVPPEMLEQIKARGYIIVHINEQHAREFMATRNRR